MNEEDIARFNEFRVEIDKASSSVLVALLEYSPRAALPALVSAMVAMCKSLSEDEDAPPFEAFISLAHEGIDALKRDFIREGIGEQTNSKGH
jgi:hypothetical protein